MKAYLLTTCILFGLITAAHVCRMFQEGFHLAKEPVFLLLTFVAGGLCFWAGSLLRGSRPR